MRVIHSAGMAWGTGGAVALLCCNPALAQTMVTYCDGDANVHVWRMGYSAAHQAQVYADTPSGAGSRQVLNGRVLIQYQKGDVAVKKNIEQKYRLKELFQHPAGRNTYVYTYIDGSKEDALNLANRIFESERMGRIVAAYPDWVLLDMARKSR